MRRPRKFLRATFATLTYTEREKLEPAVRHIMDESQCTREEAIRAFAVCRPEAPSPLDEH